MAEQQSSSMTAEQESLNDNVSEMLAGIGSEQESSGADELETLPGLLSEPDLQGLSNPMGGRILGLSAHTPGSSLPLASTAVNRIAKAEPGDVHEIAASQIELISDYHNLVLSQSQKSFWVAVTAGGIGFAFLLGAIIFFENSIGIAAISGIAAAIAEIFAAVFYRLHSRALGQFSDFNERLELIQRYLLANSIIIKHIEGEAKEQRLSELVRTIAKIQHSPEKEE